MLWELLEKNLQKSLRGIPVGTPRRSPTEIPTKFSVDIAANAPRGISTRSFGGIIRRIPRYSLSTFMEGFL